MLAEVWVVGVWFAGVWPATSVVGSRCCAPTKATVTPTPRPAAASMMPATSGSRRCLGSPEPDDRGGLACLAGWTGVPQDVQKRSSVGIWRPHLVQYDTVSSPPSAGGHG